MRGEVLESPPLGECLEPRTYYSGTPPAPYPPTIALGESRSFSEGFDTLPSLNWIRNVYGIPEGCYGLSSITRQVNNREDTAVSESILVSIYPVLDLYVDVVDDAISYETSAILLSISPLNIAVNEDSEVDDLGQGEAEPATPILINSSEILAATEYVSVGGNNLQIVKDETTYLSEICSVRADLNINTDQGGKTTVIDEVSLLIFKGLHTINVSDASTITDTKTVSIISNNLTISKTESSTVTDTPTVSLPLSTAWTVAGAGASVGTGNQPWATPGNIFTQDGLVASASLRSVSFPQSRNLQATTFGFSLPAVVTIVGVEARLRINIAGAGVLKDLSVQLIVGGIMVGSNYAKAGNYTTTFTNYDYGGATDLWGTTLTKANVEASNFGVSLQSTWVSGTTTSAQVDIVWMRIWYTV